jgi:hypothetical protein
MMRPIDRRFGSAGRGPPAHSVPFPCVDQHSTKNHAESGDEQADATSRRFLVGRRRRRGLHAAAAMRFDEVSGARRERSRGERGKEKQTNRYDV